MGDPEEEGKWKICITYADAVRRSGDSGGGIRRVCVDVGNGMWLRVRGAETVNYASKLCN